ncbi:MAG: hypothetical protein KAQ87_05355 [Candidatus Pacebacteria bacterium]|nr:hypothetical protein [Candidatus Paceibacterota bacterium]
MKSLKKILTLSILLLMTVSFGGCLNLSKKDSGYEKNEHQGIFKTTDGGKNWEHRVEIEESENFLDNVKIASMAMDPKNNSVLYLGTRGKGLYKSDNGADSWKKVTDENKVLSENAIIYDIAVENGNSDIVYMATLNNDRGELLKSEDGGESWVLSYPSPGTGKPVNAVKVDPLFKNVVYIGTEQGGFIKSENKGNTWFALNWFESGVKDFVIDFWNNNGIIVRTAKGIFKNREGGSGEWESLNKIIKTTSEVNVDISKVNSMTIDNKNPFVVYLTYLNLILVTRDGGYNWEKLNTITPSLTPIGTIPQVKQIGMIDDIIYYGAGNALYKSENKGITWSGYNIPIKGDVRYTVSDYKNSDIIYVGAFYDPPPEKKKKKNPFLPY